MKLPTLILPIFFLLLSCREGNKESNISTTEESTEKPSIEGTWELIGYYNYVNDKVTDSFKTNDGYRQIKMYTPTKVMWSKDVPKDSTEWFGYGNYTSNDSTLVEILEYGSESMSNIIDTKKEFKYELILEDDRFSQIELDDDGNRIYSENYRRIE